MEHYLSLLVSSIFIDNMALSLFLGMCTFIALSKKNRCSCRSGYCGSGCANHHRTSEQPAVELPAV